MATTYQQPGDCLTFTAPTGGVTSGTPIVIGGRFVIPTTTAAAGATFEGMLVGVHRLPKTGSQPWSEGQKIYWDAANTRSDSDPTLGIFIGHAASSVGSGSGETTGAVSLLGYGPVGEVFHVRKRFTVAQVNAGVTLVPAVPGRKVRMIDAAVIATGGAASQPLSILATATTSRKLVACAAAQLLQSAVLRAGATGAAVLGDGASFTANDVNTAVTVAKDSTDVATATGLDVSFTFALDAA
jgi:predicted RecA/RadA family phage recombinase